MVAAADAEHENQGKCRDVIQRQDHQGGIAVGIGDFLGQAARLRGIGQNARMAQFSTLATPRGAGGILEQGRVRPRLT